MAFSMRPLMEPFDKNIKKIDEMMQNRKTLNITPFDFLTILIFIANGDFVTSELIDLLMSKNILTPDERRKLNRKIIDSNNDANQFMEYLVDRYIGTEGKSDE